MAATDKDTIYIDIDDEITGIIDKLQTSSGKVVALVLPKRASAFQSIVNMKLLKRAADSAQKHLVLITSEAGLLPLAGMAGVHVAKTLTSKPEIPSTPGIADDSEESIDEDNTAEPEVTAATAGDQPVGRLAGMGILPPPVSEGVETLVLDDDSTAPEAAGGVIAAKSFDPPGSGKSKGGKKNKGLHIPNFERFRLLLVLGGLILIFLIGGLIFAVNALPKATITIDTNAQNVDSNLKLNLSTAAKTLDPDTGTMPAKLQQQQKTYTQSAPATGQKNNGNKASGSVTVTNCSGADATLVAGSGFSSGGNTYISQETVTVPDSNYKINSECKKDGNANIDVVAQSGGAAYNIAAGASFTIASSPAHLTAQGNAISGGTDNITQIVSQNDINNAKAKINIEDTSIKSDLQDQLKQADYRPLAITYSAGTPAITPSANVGDAAANVTVTEVVTYTMFGVHDNDLKTLVNNDVKTKIDTGKQSILSQGIDKAVFAVDSATATTAQLTMSTVATAGPDLDQAALKKAIAGKKSGPVKEELESRPGVKSVDIKLGPFWVSAIPKKLDKIHIIIAEPTKAPTSQSNGSNP